MIRNKNEITSEILMTTKIFVLAGPQEKFTESEFQALKVILYKFSYNSDIKHLNKNFFRSMLLREESFF